MNGTHGLLAAGALGLSVAGTLAAAPSTPPPPGPYRAVLAMDCEDVASEVVEPDRIRAVGAWTAADRMWGHKLAGYARVESLADTESVVRLHPDLVLVSSWDDPTNRVAEALLREVGVPTFEVPSQHAAKETAASLRAVAAELGDAARGERIAAAWSRRLDDVRTHRPASAPPVTALFAVAGASDLEITGAESGMNELTQSAGLDDVGVRAGFVGWVLVDTERVLALRPDRIVTRDGALMGNLRQVPGLGALPALQRPGGVIGFPCHEMAGFPLDEPDAAAAVSAQVWGEP